MKNLKNTVLIIGIVSLFSLVSCTDNFENINTNPNSPETAPTSDIFNGATRYPIAYTYDEWWMGRMTLPWMQMSGQIINQEEDHYQYRDAQARNNWNYYYTSAQDFKTIIEMCENPETQEEAAASGNLDNQVAMSRIMLVWIFDELATHFGDVPYWSYGSDDSDFQALNIDSLQPKFAPQSKIFPDMLKELKEAADQIKVDEPGMSVDNIYNGDMAKWKKFANSLRLRIANRIKGVYPDADQIIQDLISNGDLILDNEANAIQAFGQNTADANEFWESYIDRTDFEPGQTVVELLKGKRGNFNTIDPRLPKLIAPAGDEFATAVTNIPSSGYGTSQDAYDEKSYSDLVADPGLLDMYIGMPSGMPMATDRPDGKDYVQSNSSIGKASFFSYHILKPDFGAVLMEAAETHFLISENQGWDQTEYEAGVRASLKKWGVEEDAIDDFINTLPPANEENVITQKYLALFMQPDEAWNEYRRTGYPDNSVLILPGDQGTDIDGYDYTMTSMKTGNVTPTDIPARIRYPESEQSLNISNYQDAVSKLSNGDEVDSKLWWDED